MPQKKIEALAEIEAYTTRTLTDYDIICSVYHDQLYRSYPNVTSWYYLTFKPMDKPYQEDYDWFRLKQIKKVYDKFRPLCQIMWLTRETQETKIHINLLIYSDHDLSSWNDKIFHNKCKVWCKQIPCIDRFAVFKYIFKEAKTRDYPHGLDYKFFDRLEK